MCFSNILQPIKGIMSCQLLLKLAKIVFLIQSTQQTTKTVEFWDAEVLGKMAATYEISVLIALTQ